MLYPQYRTWRTEKIRKEDGVLVATDIGLEWMLPWWWEHYSRHNSHPVAFVDFGMSEEARQWCRERGEFIPLRVADIFVAEQEEVEASYVQEWEKHFGTNFWPSRRAWFKKPLACLQSPFHRTLWLDLDCEVRGSIAPLFAFSDHPIGIALCKERWKKRCMPIYNSGVIVFRRNLLLIEDWANESFANNHQFRCDQELLSHLITEQKIEVNELPELMNWTLCNGKNPDALIYHWQGYQGHKGIRHQMDFTSDLKDLS